MVTHILPGGLRYLTRSQPPGEVHLERHGALGRELATASPVAVTETGERLRSDSAFHAVLWINEWPRSLVYPGFLAPLVLSTGILRTLALHYTPVRADQAARDLRKKKTELISDAAQRRKLGQVEDAGASAELDDVLQQEADLTAGHGVLRVTGLISVSAPNAEALDAAVAAIEQAAIQASCETRRLVGQQAQAFTAAALPLCRSV
ncbi:SCO6880 family protein [Propionibacterium freudenreichii]|uniref:SCO6880 family protein n=1 Tax=Propionibacterium freudenreichii TaxID=1744 RepID=UPI003D708CA6